MFEGNDAVAFAADKAGPVVIGVPGFVGLSRGVVARATVIAGKAAALFPFIWRDGQTFEVDQSMDEVRIR
jgi:putative flippase GtrA